MSLVRCKEPVGDSFCHTYHPPGPKAADGTPRCKKHRPAEIPREAPADNTSFTEDPDVPAHDAAFAHDSSVEVTQERVDANFSDAMDRAPAAVNDMLDESGERVHEKASSRRRRFRKG
jgi:hypothetical protein